MDASIIFKRLQELQDSDYRLFQCKLIPTVDPQKVLGVRTPELRRLAKEIRNTATAEVFMQQLPHQYLEENSLHGMLLSMERSYHAVVEGLNAFLPYVDNWATCDLIRPVAFRRCPELLEGQLFQWLQAEHPDTVRFALEMLMTYYLDETFRPCYLDWGSSIRREEYYVNMMIAWYFATALAKQPKATLPYIEQRRLEPWTHNRTIQKAVESYRIPDETKAYLRTLRIR